MRASVCMATYDRPDVLRRTLDSIFSQRVPFSYEVIVVDDAGPRSAKEVCQQFGATYYRIDREPGYRNPAIARNLAYRMAVGEILICQSDDVMHGDSSIRRLVEDLHDGEFLLATVWNVNAGGEVTGLTGWPHIKQLTGPLNQRPLFFLGSVRREDMYAIGGCDEDFIDPGREDVWLAKCLINGRGLTPRYGSMEGYHQDHERPMHLLDCYRRSMHLYLKKVAAAQAGESPWQGGAPWPYSLPPPIVTASLPVAMGRVG